MQAEGLVTAWDEANAAQFIATCDAGAAVDDYGPSATFPSAVGKIVDGIVTPLPEFGLVAAKGADAAAFLHGQLSNDIENLPASQARWFGYCTPKGRLLAVLMGWRATDEILLCTARPILDAMRKRLGMYVMRAKVTLEDRSGDMVLFGVAGTRAAAVLESLGFATVPAPMERAVAQDLTLIGLPGAGATPGDSRWLLAASAQRARELWQTLSGELEPASGSLWRWLELRAGVPRIVGATSARHIPQTVNLDLIGGVSFQKGCYPGQEVVARTHYRGTGKRRMYLGHVAGEEPRAGEDVVSIADEQPVGSVVMASANPQGGADLLFEAPSVLVEASIGSATAVLRVGSQEIGVAATPHTGVAP